MKEGASTPAYLQVRAKTESRKESAIETSINRWSVSVREKAAHGAANARIRIVLAHALGVHPQTLRLIKGASSPSKLYLLNNNHPQV